MQTLMSVLTVTTVMAVRIDVGISSVDSSVSVRLMGRPLCLPCVSVRDGRLSLLLPARRSASAVFATATWLTGWMECWILHAGIVSKRLSLS